MNIAFCLIADKLSELNERLVQSPHVATIEIPLPDARPSGGDSSHATVRRERQRSSADFTAEELAEMSSGLSLVNLNVVLSQGGSRRGSTQARSAS